MVSAAYATCKEHALKLLDKLTADGKINPRQPDSIVAAEITHYRKERPTNIPTTDAIMAARRQGPPPETVDATPGDAAAQWHAAGEEAY